MACWTLWVGPFSTHLPLHAFCCKYCRYMQGSSRAAFAVCMCSLNCRLIQICHAWYHFKHIV